MCNKIGIEHPYKWLFKTNSLLFFFSISFVVLYHGVISRFIINPLINIFGYTSSTLLHDFVFLIVFLTTIVFYLPKWRNYIPSNNITLLLLALLFIYLFYRTTLHTWQFTSFKTISSLKYADVIALISLSNLLIWVKHWVKCDPIPLNKSKNTLFDDNPITGEEDDTLKYHQYAKSLASNIEESNFDKSFALGINGNWGIGKTSFINLIIKNLKKEGKIIVRFNPWDCKTPEAIILDFFDVFQEGIRPYHSSLARTLVKYSNRLVKSNENNVTRSLHLVTTSLNSLDSTEVTYGRINDALREIGRKVIVIIDDLDRLDSKEISEVLKLIRNTANFYNTFFIVAYDRNYIVNALKSSKLIKQSTFWKRFSN